MYNVHRRRGLTQYTALNENRKLLMTDTHTDVGSDPLKETAGPDWIRPAENMAELFGENGGQL